MGNTNCQELDPKLYSIILEKSLDYLGLPTNYSLIGGGTCGNAYLSNGKVYKITTDRSEAVESNKIVGKNNNHIANIFNVKQVHTSLTNEGVYLIVLEYLDISKKNLFAEIENNLDELFEENFNQDLYKILNIYATKNTTYRNVVEPKVKQILAPRQKERLYFESLLNILNELKQNRINSIDVHFNNLGIKKNGNIAFFDLGFGDDSDTHLNSIDIGEQIVERIMSYMKGASAMNVKKKCQIDGNRDGTSTACNQGDISNIELKPISESMRSFSSDHYKELDDNRLNEIIDNIILYSFLTPNGKPKYVTGEEYDDFVYYYNVYHYNSKRIENLLANKNSKKFNDNMNKIIQYIKDQKINYSALAENIKSIVEFELGEIVDEEVNEYENQNSNADLAYRKWKRDNVTYRGISDTTDADGHNGGMAMLGVGLYSVPASNKAMARKYGNLRMLVNAKPKNPKIFNTLNDWEIWFQNNVVFPISKAKGKTYPDGRDVNSITDEMLKRGYDGVIIKGREIVNYKPENVHYYQNERQLEMYYEYYIENKNTLREEENVNNFNLNTFDTLKSFGARKKYADERLQKIGAGSSRIVYNLNDGTVLKLASNKKGFDQNREECGLGQDNYFSTIVAQVKNCHNDDLWIVSELAKKVTPNKFKELTGVDIRNVYYYLMNLKETINGKREIYNLSPKTKSELDENDFVHQLAELMGSYKLEAGDLGRLSSYGEVNRNGQADIVVSDYGLTSDVYNTHYDKSAKRKMYENYFDMNEEVKVDINDLPFKTEVEQAGGKIYSVGGAVRDKLLGKESKDLDILITGIPLDKLEQILHKYGKVDNVGKSFGIIKFNTPQTGEIDIAIPRQDKKNDTGGYQGFDVTSDHTLPIEKDLERRDFTINAIAKDSSGLMIDPYGGQGDIEKKQIKMVNPQAFSDDPLRQLRAVQFSSRFGFEIEPETMKAIQQNASKIKEISPERILIEFDKIVKKGDPTIGARLLLQTGLYDQIFGVSKGINLAGFDKVKTMGELIYKLTNGNINSPSEFFKNNLKGDLDTYNEIKALELGGQFNGNKKTIFDMYKIYPKSIDTLIFSQDFSNTVKYMRDYNIPFSLKEVPVNGNDLIEMGLKGKEIGNTFVNILSMIYKEELPNERNVILNYVKSLK